MVPIAVSSRRDRRAGSDSPGRSPRRPLDDRGHLCGGEPPKQAGVFWTDRGCSTLAAEVLKLSAKRAVCRCEARAEPNGSSTVLVSRRRGWLGTPGLLRRRRLTLHLFLRVLRRSCGVTGGTVHRAGRRMLIGTRSCLSIRRRTAYRRSGTCILRCTAGIARAGQRGAGTQDENGTRRENESFCSHVASPGLSSWTAPITRQT